VLLATTAGAARELPLTATAAHLTPSHHGLAGVATTGARMTSLLGLFVDPGRARLLHALDVAEEVCVGDLALVLDVTEDQAGYALRTCGAPGSSPGARPGV
jgi:hypothetical protein